MNFLRSLFKQEKASLEYVESKPQQSEVDVQNIPKDQIKPFLQQTLSSGYWESCPSLLQDEVFNISSLAETEDRIKQLDNCLNITTHGLFLEVMDHYDSFLSGLDNIQKINILLEQSKFLAHGSRQQIQALQSDIYKKYLRIAYLQKRQERLTGLINEINNFKDISFAVSLSIKQAIKQGNLYEALLLCNEAAIKLKTLDVSKYRALSGVTELAEKRKGKVYVKMQATLRGLCHNFDSKLYENMLLSYTTIATYDDINRAIQAEFMHSVSRFIKESIEEAVPYIPTSSIEQMIKITPLNLFLSCIRTILKNLTQLMYSHHLLSRWHEENE